MSRPIIFVPEARVELIEAQDWYSTRGATRRHCRTATEGARRCRRSGAHIRGHDRIAVRTVASRLSCVAPSLACIDMPW